MFSEEAVDLLGFVACDHNADDNYQLCACPEYEAKTRPTPINNPRNPRNMYLTSAKAKIEDFVGTLSQLLTCIILDRLNKQCCEDCQETYLETNHLSKYLPWTLRECVQFIMIHWHLLFAEVLPRNCLIQIKHIYDVFVIHSGIEDKEITVELVKFGFAMSAFFKDKFSCDSDNIKELLSNIRSIGDSLK